MVKNPPDTDDFLGRTPTRRTRCDSLEWVQDAGVADDAVFARAQDDGRTIVTDNISDYEMARRGWESRGRTHHGIIYALNPPFNRHRGDSLIGEMVHALEHFLGSPEPKPEPFDRVHYLRRIDAQAVVPDIEL